MIRTILILCLVVVSQSQFDNYYDYCIKIDYEERKCVKCQDDYDLILGTCVNSEPCGQREYYSEGEKQCKAVSPDCDQFNSFNGDCLTCIDPTAVLQDGKCLSSCSPPDVLIEGICKKVKQSCSENADLEYFCESCSSLYYVAVDGKCKRCLGGYFKKGNSCYPVSPECAQWFPQNGTCSVCKSQTYPPPEPVNGVCNGKQPPKCSSDQYLSGEVCKDIPKECGLFSTSTGLCITCADSSMVLEAGNCQQPSTKQCEYGLIKLKNGSCVEMPIGCQTISLETGRCLVCIKGYLEDQGQCIVKTCQDGKVLNSFYTCIYKPPFCLFYDSREDQCAYCVEGYVLNSKKHCIKQEECTVFDGFGRCYQDGGVIEQTCKWGHQWNQIFRSCEPVFCGFNVLSKDGKTCIPMPENCADYNSKEGLCVRCTSADFEIVSGVCTNKNKDFSGVTPCLLENYYLSSSGACQPKPDNCNQMNIATESCQICASGFKVNAEGGCSMTQCPEGQYLAYEGFACKLLPLNCAEFSDLLNACIVCNSGYELVFQGTCKLKICKANQTRDPVQGCILKQCALGYALSLQGFCLPIPKFCLDYNPNTGKCLECESGYRADDLTGRCIKNLRECREDEALVGSVCLQKPPNCKDLHSKLGYCISCNRGYVLQSYLCIKTKQCLPGQSLNQYGNCQATLINCVHYYPNGDCASCANGRPPVNNVCCPPGLTYNGGTCSRLEVSPLAMSGSSSVGRCESYHPSLGFCLKCSEGTSPDPSDSMLCI